jgi:predicted RNase H-like nuclease (RuvC/YqgF family)
VQNSLDAIGRRVSSAEDQFRTWASDWDGMNDRLGKVERNSSAGLRQARDYATTQAAKVQQELQAELNNRSQSMASSIGELEASQEQDQQQMAKLQQEISSVRSETHSQLAQAEEHTSREIGEIHGALARNRDDFDMVARSLDRRRLDFEISKDRTTEVASGVTLTVSDFNVSYQRVEGRLHLLKDGRILWIRGQGIQQPVRFYSMTDNRPYEVVFTRVTRDSAVGYILAPADMAASSGSPGEQMATMQPDAAENLALAR